MSAGSPRRSHSQSRNSSGCVIVSPQHVTDPSILDSVAGFINEVATYNVPCDTKDQIQWAKFEQLDCHAVLDNLNGDKVIPSALILVLGYSTGIQVWAIPASGEAVELLAWRHGSVRVLRLLPSPYIVGCGSQPDVFTSKRPLMALCDSTAPGPHHCALSFLSLKTGEQVKQIKFKNPILDVLANRRSVVVTFSERIAVFDAFTLEDRLTVTTCYLSPGIYPNPIALGSRWMAYAEKKLISNKRSSGGNEGEGVQSYTATVLHAAKSLGKGLRELGETVASSLTGNQTFKPGSSPGTSQPMGINPSDTVQKGIVTILDVEHQDLDDSATQTEGIIAHFAAHSEAIVCLEFDPSGLLLLTADKRGHNFHLFRIHPHPGGPTLAAVHHLYILHRGDTTARVQDMCFSPDSRWVTVSTLRGTSHVFPITPYGGNVGVRTHATPHVVNRMSRFHRSAGLPVEGRSNSPVSLFEAPINSNLPYNNPRLPPYPHPTSVHPLAQIRQPLFVPAGSNTQPRAHGSRQRLNSSDENLQEALRLCCCFAPARAWFDNTTPAHDIPLAKQQAKPVESLFVMSCNGTLLQYDLDPHHIASVPKEKVCDETPIELTVQAKAQWALQRQMHFGDTPLPVSLQNLNLLPRDVSFFTTAKLSHMDDRWLSQVEIVTHAGPHRRLWMGPQFTFKTYNAGNGSPVSLIEAQTTNVNHSKPMNMPSSTAYPILIESGSVSSCEQSPKLLDTYQRFSEEVGVAGELQLKEDLADAMLESPGVRESGGRCVIVSMKPHTTGVAKIVNPLGTVVTIHSDEDIDQAITEDVVIHENCDEALFRPVIAPKTLIFTENKNQSSNKTLVAVPDVVKPKPCETIKEENGRRIKVKMDSSFKAHDIDTVEYGKAKCEYYNQPVEVKAKHIKSHKSDSKYNNKSEIKIDIQSSKTDVNSKILKPTTKNESVQKVRLTPNMEIEPVPKSRTSVKVDLISKSELCSKIESKPESALDTNSSVITDHLSKAKSSTKISSKLEPKMENVPRIKSSIKIEQLSKVESRKIEENHRFQEILELAHIKTGYQDYIEKIMEDSENYVKTAENPQIIDKTYKTLEDLKTTEIIDAPVEVKKINDKKESLKYVSPPKPIETVKCAKKPLKTSVISVGGNTTKTVETVKISENVSKSNKSTSKYKENNEAVTRISNSSENSKKAGKNYKALQPSSDTTDTESDTAEKKVDSILNKSKVKYDSKLKNSEINKKLNYDDSSHTQQIREETPFSKILITTPDLMDSEDPFDFPLTSNKFNSKDNKTLENDFKFPSFSKIQESAKEEMFEDARDTEESSKSLPSFRIGKEIPTYKSGKYQGLEPEEIIASSEEEKASSKKIRKPKSKLGVRLSKGKDSLEKEKKDIDSCSVEVTLPAPRKSWSSIVASKPPEQELVKEEAELKPILDIPEIVDADLVEDLPKKSYSTVMKQHLFEIDPQEDLYDSSILLPEKILKASATNKIVDDFSQLKINTKSSDDEKPESSSSQVETTESSDDSISKVVAMDTEEDSCQPEIAKSSRQGTDKPLKRKSKKKKR